MKQFPYLQRKKLYPKTEANEPIVYYKKTVSLASHYGKCAGCGGPPTRVDSYYHFELCDVCEADVVAGAIADHVFENTIPNDGEEIKQHLDKNV